MPAFIAPQLVDDPASSIIQRGMWASQRPRTQNRISTTRMILLGGFRRSGLLGDLG